MREKIRIPCDVELLTKFLEAGSIELTGTAQIVVQSERSGKFNKVTKLSITLPEFGEIVVIHPKERNGKPTNGRTGRSTIVQTIDPLTEAERSAQDVLGRPVVPINGGKTGADNSTDTDTSAGA